MNATEKLTELMLKNTNGCFLAKQLRHAGYSPDEAMEALLEKKFTVQKEEVMWGTVLHISRKPLEAGVAVALALTGGDTVEVAWRNLLQKA